MKTLGDALPEELERCRELLEIYRTIPTGFFGAAMINQAITEGERALDSGDLVQMIKAYESLRECE